ncbi:MAG: NAD(P)H-hydrate epimerase [Anaerolineales bacterium]|nr:MAG: NAD(P)H-hydrate epimerase [Anaerolineales bacterium]
MKVVTTEEMRRIEKAADAGGLSFATMMENAGRAVAEACQRGQRMGSGDRRILVLVGPGNNGGDGLVAARYLHDAGTQVQLYIGKRRLEDDDNYALTQERGIVTIRAKDDPNLESLKELLHEADVIVDAFLGTGVSKPIEGPLKDVLETAKEEIEKRRKEEKGQEPLVSPSSPPSPSLTSSPLIVAVDVPSGLNCDSGAVDPVTLPANLTVTFGFPKVGQFLFPGAEYLGELLVADIDIPPSLADDVSVELATPQMVSELLPKRPLGAHKGTFGKALVVAGSVNYTGAAYLASAAATRVGAGLVTLALAANLHPILASKLSEVTFLLLPHDMGAIVPEAMKILSERVSDYNALLLGPGLGRDEKTIEFVQQFLSREWRSRRPRVGFLATGEEEAVGKEGKKKVLPLSVIDADGLNALADRPNWWKYLGGPNVLTPHPGEMARLVGCGVGEVEADRIGAAREMAKRWKQVVTLKGAHTVVAAPDGQTVIIPFANPGLSTAGSGDVLAGAIVGFLAQGLPPFAAAVAGAYLHGLAGDLARDEIGAAGMVAGDLLPMLPQAIALVSQ